MLTTLAVGSFVAREFRTRCRSGCILPPVGSRRLAELAPAGQRFGYDLIVWVGLARYRQHLQRSEIQARLARRGIALSSGSLSALCERFLAALERLHWQRAPALRAALAQGYALHLDATSDKGKGGTFVCLDGVRNWVLHAVKIASENEYALRPAVEHTIAVFGDPLATVRDLSSALAKTLAGTRQRGIPDLLCHYHFLAAVGKRLLDQDYASLRDRLARSGLRSRLRELLQATRGPAAGLREDLPALLLWLLEGTAHKHPSYPFALPHLDFYRRCAGFPTERDRRLPTPRTPGEQAVLRQVDTALADLRWLQRPAPVAQRLQHRWQLFCELRDVLRLSAHDLPHGQSPAPASPSQAALAHALQALAADLKHYRQALRQRIQDLHDNGQPDPPEALVLDYLDRYGEQLCGHPVVRDPSGRVVAVVARTNNVLEQFFASAKQGMRRRLGRAHLGRDMEDQPAQAAFVANLRDPDYVRIVCGSLDQLPQAFAALERPLASNPPRLQRSNRDASLRRRNRAWEQAATQGPPPPSSACHIASTTDL